MNAVSLNNLLSYLQGLSLTASNKKWLADHLYEAAKEETEAKKFTPAQLVTLEKARALSKKQIHGMEQQEFMSVDDLKLLLYRKVDDIYNQA